MYMRYTVFGAKVYYSDRKGAVVRIENDLILTNGQIPLKIWLPREVCSRYSVDDRSIVQSCIKTICEFATKDVSSRKREISMPIHDIPRGRMILRRKDIPLIKEFLQSPPPQPPGSHFLFLYQILKMLFFAEISRFFNYIRKGRYGKVYREYTCALPAALWLCREIVLKARDDRRLQSRIVEIANEPEIAAYRKRYQDLYEDEDADVPQGFMQQLTIVALAYRALKWKWQEGQYPNILDMHPQDVFMQYFYGKKRKEMDSFADLSKRDPFLWDKVMEIFKKHILGPSDEGR